MQESWLGTISLLNQRSDAPSSRCTVDVVVALNLLSISFIKFERVAPLAVVDVTKFRARGTFDSSTLSVEGSLGNFRIQNPQTPIAAYRDVFTVMGSHEELFSFTYRSAGDDSAITMRSCPSRIVYMQQYTLELADYIFEGILGALFDEAVPLAAASTPTYVQDEDRLSMDISLEQPTILFAASTLEVRWI